MSSCIFNFEHFVFPKHMPLFGIGFHTIDEQSLILLHCIEHGRKREYTKVSCVRKDSKPTMSTALLVFIRLSLWCNDDKAVIMPEDKCFSLEEN